VFRFAGDGVHHDLAVFQRVRQRRAVARVRDAPVEVEACRAREAREVADDGPHGGEPSRWSSSTARLPMKPFAPTTATRIIGPHSAGGRAPSSASPSHGMPMSARLQRHASRVAQAREPVGSRHDEGRTAADGVHDVPDLRDEALLEAAARRAEVWDARRRAPPDCSRARKPASTSPSPSSTRSASWTCQRSQPSVALEEVLVRLLRVAAEPHLARHTAWVRETNAAVGLDAAHRVVLVVHLLRCPEPPRQQVEGVHADVGEQATGGVAAKKSGERAGQRKSPPSAQ